MAGRRERFVTTTSRRFFSMLAAEILLRQQGRANSFPCVPQRLVSDHSTVLIPSHVCRRDRFEAAILYQFKRIFSLCAAEGNASVRITDPQRRAHRMAQAPFEPTKPRAVVRVLDIFPFCFYKAKPPSRPCAERAQARREASSF